MLSLIFLPHSQAIFDGLQDATRFCILQAIKNWRRETPGNEAKLAPHVIIMSYRKHMSTRVQTFIYKHLGSLLLSYQFLQSFGRQQAIFLLASVRWSLPSSSFPLSCTTIIVSTREVWRGHIVTMSATQRRLPVVGDRVGTLSS